MGAKQSTTITNVDEVKDDIPSSTNAVSKGTKNEECLQSKNDVGVCKNIEFGDSSGNITVILQQHPIDVSGVRLVPIVDTTGCGCIGCDIHACSEGRLPGSEPKDSLRSSVGRCNCGNQCMCVYPCNCESTKSQCMCVPPCECKPTKTHVKSSWSVPHIFTKTTDIEKRLDDIEVQFNKFKESLNNMDKRMEKRLDDLEVRLNKIDESLNNNDKRIDTLETISKQMDVVSQGSVEDIHAYFDGRLKEVQSNMIEYVPLSAIPYCTHCKTIVLNGQVCDCGLIVQ